MKTFYKIIILFVFINTGFVLNAKSYNSKLDTENTIEKKYPKDTTINLVLPPASITTNASSVCVGGTQPIITFTATGGSTTSNYTFVYAINGVTQTKIETSGTNVATLNVPTTTADSFQYTLISVTEGSNSTVSITGQSVTILINALPTATISTTTPTTFCNGDSVVLTTNTGAGLSYVWKKDNALFSPSQINSTYTATTSGNYTVTVTNSSGCSQTSVNQTVTVNPKPVIDFTFTVNQCSGVPVGFSTTSSGVTYTWNFGDLATSSQQNPTHTFSSFGCGTQSFNVSLTITGSNGCSTTLTKNITINRQPDISFKDQNANSANQFSNCLNATNTINYSISVGNTSASSSCINTYSIDWGDSSINSNITFPITHNYTTRGVFNMVVTATGSNGCRNSKTYIVKNISNPSGGILSPGGTTDMCLPAPIIQYSIGNWALNSLGTTYDVDYGDLLPHLILIQDNMVSSSYYNSLDPSKSENYPVPYSYSTVSCPNTDFTITLIVKNACKSTTGTVSGGNTIKAPEARFTAPNISCKTTNVLFTNTTTLGYDSDCIRDTEFSWDFGDPASGTSNNISTGPITTTPNVNHMFSGPGKYNVVLSTKNGCATTTDTHQICIEPPLDPKFNLSTNLGCTPLAVTADSSTTDLSQVCSTLGYLWHVAYASGFCGSTLLTPIPDQTTKNALFNFVTPGTYSIKLTISGSSCGSVSLIKKVEVKQPPTVVITPIAPICQTSSTTTINPTASIVNCGTQSPMTYEWSFTGGTPATPTALTTASPGLISYSSSGTFPFSLKVTNECGPTTVNSSVIINPLPTISGTLFACKNGTSQLTGSATPNTTAPWASSALAVATVSPTGKVTGVSAGTTTITYTDNNGCKTTALFTVNPLGQVTPPSNQVVCNGGPITLITFATTNATGATSYTWTNNTSSIGLPPFGIGDISSFIATNSGNTPVTATITVTPTYSNGGINCPGSTIPFTITVNPTAQVTQPTNAVFCAGTPTTAIAFSTPTTGAGTVSYNWANDKPSIGLAASGSGSVPVFNPINTSTAPIIANITVTPTYLNGGVSCTGIAKTFTITINPKGQVNTILNQTVCNGGTTTTVLFNTTNTVGTTSYSWTNSNANIGLAISGNGDIPSFTGININNYPSVGTIVVTPIYTNGTVSCTGPTQSFSITVNPIPQVNTISNQVVCHSGSTTAINFTTPNTGAGTVSYNWTNNTPSIGLVVSGSGNIAAFIASNTGTAPVIATITVNPSYSNGGITCTGTAKTFTITVNPTPTVNSPLPQTVCNGMPTTTILFSGSIPTTVYTWTNTNNTIGIGSSGSGSITSFNAINTGTIPIIASITVTPTDFGCSGTAQTFSITINPSPAVIFLPSPQTICSGASSLPVTLTSTTAGATYSWTAAQPSGITGVTTSGTNTIPVQTLVNSTNTPIIITYSATATIAGGATCAGAIYTYTITVNPKPVISEVFTTTACSGSAFTVTPAGSALNSIPSGTTYSWPAPSVTGGITGGTLGTTQPTINGTLTNTTNTAQTATYSVTPSANGCSGTTLTVTVTINPKPVIAAITPASICSGTSFSETPINTGATIVPVGTTYTWTIGTNTNITGQSASSAVGVTSVSQTLTNTTNIPQSIIYTVTPTSGDAGNCIGNPFPITVTVNPKPAISNIFPAGICSGTPFSVTPTNGAGNIVPIGTTYTWTNPVSNPIGAVTGGSLQAIGQNIISQTLTNTTNNPATLTYTVTPISGSCQGNIFDVSVSVSPTPSTLSLTNLSYCNGVLTTPINFSNLVTGTTYAWTNSNTAIGLSSPSGIGNIPAFTATNGGNSAISSTISVIATANGCSRIAETFTITVNPSPAVTFSLSPQTICSGDSSALVTLNSTTAGATYSWTAAQPSGITGVTTSGTSTIPAQTLVNSTNAPINVIYSATATIAGGATCSGAVYTYTITVNPKPLITEVFTTTACSGSAFTVTPADSVLNSIPSGTTYSWPAPSVTGGITGTIGTAQPTINGTLTNTTNTAQTATYTVTPSANGCSGTTLTVTVTINPKPVIAAITPASICSGTSFSETPINAGATIVPVGTTYTWTVGTNTNITGQSASTAIGITSISQTLINTSNIPQSIIYTVTPTSGDTGNCIGTPFTITVTVNPKPAISNISPAGICSGTSFSVTPTNGAGNIVPIGTTYTWTNPVSNPIGAITGGSSQTAGQNVINQTLTNTTNNPATLTYTVTPISGSCQGNTFDISVSVNPTPSTLSLTDLSYCNGVLTTPINFSNLVIGTTYTWTNSNTAIGLSASSGIGNIPAFTATNGGNSAIDSTISIIATANGCSRIAETFTITVNPSPAVTFSPSPQTICSGDSSALVTLNSTTVGATYSWLAVQPSGITGVTTSGTSTIPAQTLVNSTNAPITVTYSATATIAGGATCAGAVYTYTITVNPKPNIDNQSFTICNNQSFLFNPVNSIPTISTIIPIGTIYTWTTSPNSSISGQSAGNGTLISQTLSNSSDIVQTITYNVIPSYLNCTGNPFTITITVYPTPRVIFSSSNQIICNNTQSSPINLSTNAVGTINYSWTCTNPPLGITGIITSGTNTIPIQTLVNTTSNLIAITYTAHAEIIGGITCAGPSSNYTITVNPTIVTSSVLTNYNSYNVSVFGGTDGAIDLTVSGGSGIYTYNWTGPNAFISLTQDISNVVAGNYSVTINDGYCSAIILNFTLTQPPELLIQETTADHFNLLCFGDSNGTLGVRITQGSVSPYDYQILNSSGVIISFINNTNSLNHVFNGLTAGTYSINVIDANGGIKKIPGLTITQPNDIIIVATTTPISCYDGNDGSITLTVTGGTGSYQGSWDNLATGLFQNNLSAGTYTILITDANNCTKPITVNLPEPPIFTVNPVVKQISCFGANDGSINLNFVGGIAPIVLTWSDGSTAGTTRNNLGPGTYSVIIKDSKPCIIFKSFTIIEPQPLSLSTNITHALDCDNANTGAINLLVSGGTPPFTYVWSNGAITEDLINISAGNYLVTVTDARGCTKSIQNSINRPPPIAIEIITKTDFDCNTKYVKQTFEANVSGGLPPYQLNWSSGTVSGINNEFMNTNLNGTIILGVTDALGCKANYSYNVNTPTLGTPDLITSSFGYTTYGFYSVNDPIQFTNKATGDYVSMIWDFGDGTFSNQLNPIHQFAISKNYVVKQIVTYPFGCVYTNTITLMVEKGYLLVVPTAFTPNNDSVNDTYRPVTKTLKNVHLDIYDTWGSLIYSEIGGDVLKGWDGKIKGVISENGNYFCKVSAETFYGTIINESTPLVLIK